MPAKTASALPAMNVQLERPLSVALAEARSTAVAEISMPVTEVKT